jgi:hypothetical protein
MRSSRVCPSIPGIQLADDRGLPSCILSSCLLHSVLLHSALLHSGCSFIRPGGLVLAHNIEMVPDYVRAVTTNPALETILYPEGGALSITLRKADPTSRILPACPPSICLWNFLNELSFALTRSRHSYRFHPFQRSRPQT